MEKHGAVILSWRAGNIIWRQIFSERVQRSSFNVYFGVRVYITGLASYQQAQVHKLEKFHNFLEALDQEQGITSFHDKNSDKANNGIGEKDGIRISDYSYDVARALSKEIEDGSPALKEVFKIRDIIANPYTAVTELYECLRRLELIQLTVETLKVFTSITIIINVVSKLAIFLAFTILLNSVQPVLSGVAVGLGWQAYVAWINMGCYYVIGVPLGVLLGWV